MSGYNEPWAMEDRRQERADRGAIKCDSCGGLIRVGEIKYTLDIDGLELTICDSCKGELVSSAAAHGCEDMQYWG